jgi:REP element-mobilizing transposase RayT
MKVEFNNLYVHFVLSTFQRHKLIEEGNRDRIEKYITGIVNHQSSKLYAIYANPDHVHILLSKSPSISEEDLITNIVDSSEKFINQNKLAKGVFQWQQSASAFSVSKSAIDKTCQYILNQPEHHKKVSFEEEYQEFIRYYQDTLKK